MFCWKLHGLVVYYYDTAAASRGRGGAELRANATCRRPGYVFTQSPATDRIWPQRSSISVHCAAHKLNRTELHQFRTQRECSHCKSAN